MSAPKGASRNKRWRIVAIVAGVLLLGGLGIYLTTPREPTYRGRILSAWINDTYKDEAATRDMAKRSIKAIGTTAIPTVLAWMEASNSPVRDKLNALLVRQNIISFHLTTAREKNGMALRAFQVLGNDAMSAVPALTNLIQSSDEDLRIRALNGLFSIDDGKRVMLPVILPLLNSTNHHIQYDVASYLNSRYRGDAEAAGVYKLFPELENPKRGNSGRLYIPPSNQ